MNKIYHGKALDALKLQEESTVDLIYTDPPFGTQNFQILSRKKDGEVVSKISYDDRHDDYMDFIKPHLSEFHRVLKPTGTLYLHLDYRWVHYVKVALDDVFGRECFMNEVIWAYDYGGRGKRCWPKKHDTILVYSKTPNEHVFNWNDIDRIPYMAPGLQKDKTRANDGKVPTDVWWMSIVGTQSRERNGYPSQKPVKLIERAVLASSPIGGVVMDPFAGSGTTGEAAYKHGRQFILSDVSPLAKQVMEERFNGLEFEWA